MTEIACVIEAHDALGECCLWCPATRRVWWLDIQKPALQSYDPATREHRVYPLPGKHCGCAALRRSGGLVLALDNGLHGYDPATGKLNLLVHAAAAGCALGHCGLPSGAALAKSAANLPNKRRAQ